MYAADKSIATDLAP